MVKNSYSTCGEETIVDTIWAFIEVSLIIQIKNKSLKPFELVDNIKF